MQKILQLKKKYAKDIKILLTIIFFAVIYAFVVTAMLFIAG